MNMSGFMNPASRMPPGRSTRNVAAQLPGRVVEHCHAGARRGQDRALLAAAGSQAQYRHPGQVCREPAGRRGLVTDQHNRPVAGPRLGDDIGPDRPGPLVAIVYLAVSGGTVMRHRIEVLRHTSAA